MASEGFIGDGMDGHYIEVDGPGSESEILEALDRLVGPESIASGDHCPPVLTLAGGRTIVFVDVAPEADGPVLLAVGDLDGDDEARARAAETICRTLSAHTPWTLHCSADAQGHVASMRWAC
jgi:hypothetical protein